MFLMRFDMRSPAFSPASASELYQCALDMCEWGESHGCLTVVVSQHHSSADGFLPSPLILASAIAARTQTLPINIGALLVNMYDPIKLAEDMNVLDIISQGRVNYTIGLGYRPEEYDMFGVDLHQRGKVMDEKLEALTRALSGERFDYRGRSVHVTPSSYLADGIVLSYGGHSEAAARRAGKYGLSFMGDGGDADLEVIYRQACEAHHHEPGMFFIPEAGTTTTLFVAEDVDKAWEEIGPYMLHDAMAYAAWMESNPTATYCGAKSVDELRALDSTYRIVTPAQAIETVHCGKPLVLQPLSGGLPPEIAWKSLKLIEKEVLPAI